MESPMCSPKVTILVLVLMISTSESRPDFNRSVLNGRSFSSPPPSLLPNFYMSLLPTLNISLLPPFYIPPSFPPYLSFSIALSILLSFSIYWQILLSLSILLPAFLCSCGRALSEYLACSLAFSLSLSLFPSLRSPSPPSGAATKVDHKFFNPEIQFCSSRPQFALCLCRVEERDSVCRSYQILRFNRIPIIVLLIICNTSVWTVFWGVQNFSDGVLLFLRTSLWGVCKCLRDKESLHIV